MTFVQMVFCAIFGYLVGGFSSAITISLARNKQDVRSVGSGNAGATNMLRNFGWRAGLLTFGCDVLKGALATAMGLWSFGPDGAVICGVAAVVGHTYPISYGFKGGKGISATVGMMLVLAPKIMIITIVLGVIVIYFTRIVSIGSLLGNVALVVFSWTLYYPEKLSLCIGISLLLLLNAFSHRENIVRLFKGTESKMDWKHLSSRFKRTKSGKIIVPEEENTETK